MMKINYLAWCGLAMIIAVLPEVLLAETLTVNQLKNAECITVQRARGPILQVGTGCPTPAEQPTGHRPRIRPIDCMVVSTGGIAGASGRELVSVGAPDCNIQPPPGTPQGVPPTIADVTLPWVDDDDAHVFTAEVDPGALHSVDRVYLAQTRHFWPGREKAHVFLAEREGTTNTYTVTPPQTWSWVKADHVFYKWVVEYTSENTDQNGIAESTVDDGVHDFVYLCSNSEIEATREQLAEDFQNINDNPLFNPNFPVPAHINPHVSLKDQGIPYASPGALFETGSVSAGSPSIIFFEEGPPTRLVGIGYGQLYSDSKRRPNLECVPSSEWFVHEAGWHLPDGDMELYGITGTEDVPGQTPVDTFFAPEPGPPGGVWHPRIWDLRVWRPNSGTDNVVLAIDYPDGIDGISLPDNTFFRPETFE